jgi:general secretion pathway protein D
VEIRLSNTRIHAILLTLAFGFLVNSNYAAEPAKTQPNLKQRVLNVISNSKRLKTLNTQKTRLQQQQRNFAKLSTAAQEEAKPTPPSPAPVRINNRYQKTYQALRHELLKAQTSAVEQARPPPARTTPPINDRQVWNLRNADIHHVITEVARQTGKKFIVDPRVQGKVTLIAHQPLSSKALYHVFLSVLDVAGYSAIQQGPIVKIIPSITARYAPAPLASNQHKASGDEVIARVIAVKYVSATQLVPVLRPLVPNWNIINAYRPTNSLVVVGQADHVERLAAIIQRVDTASHDDIDILPLQDAIASDLVKTLASLQQGARNPDGPRVSVAADDRSNAILISGPPAVRLRTKVLISQLDSQSLSGVNGHTQVIYLEYMQAQDLVPILAGVARSQFSGTVGTLIGTKRIRQAPALVGNGLPASAAPTVTPPAQPAQSDTATTGPKIEIIAEPNTNAVILNAPPNIIRVLKTVIAKLDIRPAQVLVEALIAEVSENDIQNLGVEWGQVGELSTDAALGGTLKSGFGFINKNFFHDLVGTLHFLADENQANILSTPSLVVLDNHLAHIKVGNEVSIIRSSQPSNANGTTTATPFNTFDRESVGLVLNVTPQITKNNSIRLSISHQNNTPRNIDDRTGTQAFNISEIQTSVIVQSGDIVVLGGLTQNEYLSKDVKTPYLGNLPGLGGLLKRHQKTRSRKKLMVFLRPLILRSDDKSIYVANEKYNQLRQAQSNMMSKTPYRHQPQHFVLPQQQPRKHLPLPFHRQPKRLHK